MEDCESAGFHWVPSMHHGDHHEDNSDMVVTITSDGVAQELGNPNFEWMWIENLMGPVDGSDGLPVVVFQGTVWDLLLPAWTNAQYHEIKLTESHGPLADKCDTKGERGGDVGEGNFAVYDSWAWSPISVEFEGAGWEATQDGEYGWISSFNCQDQEELNSLTVSFVKTLNDYNSENLEDWKSDVGPQNDWTQDVSDNLPPECHLFVTLNADDATMPNLDVLDVRLELEDAEEMVGHFNAPSGDYDIELAAGTYFLSVHCYDMDGDMIWTQITLGGETMEVLEASELFVYQEFQLMAGMPDITVGYHWDSSGGHSGSGIITVSVPNPIDTTDDGEGNVTNSTTTPDADGNCPQGLVLNADGTDCVAPSPDNVGDIIEDIASEDSGAIPGFTSMLGIISMLGAVLFMSRRNE